MEILEVLQAQLPVVIQHRPRRGPWRPRHARQAKAKRKRTRSRLSSLARRRRPSQIQVRLHEWRLRLQTLGRPPTRSEPPSPPRPASAHAAASVASARRRHLLAHPPVSPTAFGPTRTHATQPNRIRPRPLALGRMRPHSAAPSAPHRIRPRTAALSPGRPPPAAFHRARTHSHAFARCARPSHSHAAALGRTTPDPARPAHAFARSRTHLARAPHEPRTPPAADRARSAALR